MKIVADSSEYLGGKKCFVCEGEEWIGISYSMNAERSIISEMVLEFMCKECGSEYRIKIRGATLWNKKKSTNTTRNVNQQNIQLEGSSRQALGTTNQTD